MSVIASVVGAVLIGAVCVDAFQTLFHPAGHGAISDWIARGVWKLFRKAAETHSNLLTFAGPVAILVTILGWVVPTIMGFGLIYWPRMQQHFVVSSSMDPNQLVGFWEALVF